MRGDEGGKVIQSRLLPPSYLLHVDEHILRSVGRWLKFDGSGCKMYINSLTKGIVSAKPSKYDEEADQTCSSNELAAEVNDQLNGLPFCSLSDLPAFIDEKMMADPNKTLLLVDNSADQNVRTYYSYKEVLEDVSALTVPFAKAGVKRNELIERCRKSLVGAIKSGRTFVLYLGSMTIEHADWKKKLCKKNTFPVEAFINSGRKLLEVYMGSPRYKELFREEDLEAGEAVAREGFRLIVVTSLLPKDLEVLLEESIPLGYMEPVLVTK